MSVREQILKVRELAQKQRYEEAYNILKRMDDPLAERWLEFIYERAPHLRPGRLTDNISYYKNDEDGEKSVTDPWVMPEYHAALPKNYGESDYEKATNWSEALSMAQRDMYKTHGVVKYLPGHKPGVLELFAQALMAVLATLVTSVILAFLWGRAVVWMFDDDSSMLAKSSMALCGVIIGVILSRVARRRPLVLQIILAILGTVGSILLGKYFIYNGMNFTMVSMDYVGLIIGAGIAATMVTMNHYRPTI